MAFTQDGDFSDIRTSDIRAHQSISPFGTNPTVDEADADAYDPALYSGSPLFCGCCSDFIDRIFARAAVIY